MVEVKVEPVEVASHTVAGEEEWTKSGASRAPRLLPRPKLRRQMLCVSKPKCG